VYEGQSGVIAYLLDGPESRYTVAFPAPGQPLRAILETFTKAHSAVNHAQAFIDLACELRPQVDLQQVREVVVHTNSAVHTIVGSGSNDPEKSPMPVETWISLAYLVAVALEDGGFHHEHSYATHAPTGATIDLWRRVSSRPCLGGALPQALPDRPALGGRLASPQGWSGHQRRKTVAMPARCPTYGSRGLCREIPCPGGRCWRLVLEAFLHLVRVA
jgi:2-methylcitrate dehydratase